MDTWIDAQAKIDQGIRMLESANNLIQEGREMMERINAEVPLREIKEGQTVSQGRGMHDEQPWL